jgi:transposase
MLGRKNWMFCDTVAGTKANAALYSPIETARASKLIPFDYLKSLFILPSRKIVTRILELPFYIKG